MANSNRVDELDNQLETTGFESETNISDEQFDEERVDESEPDVDLAEQSCEDAVKANPKRLSAAQRKKASAIIEGLIDDAELSNPEGQKRAWDRLHEKFGADHPQPFEISADLTANDVVDHPKFGIGFVVEQINPKKINVLFEDGLRKLACNVG